jgi:DNA-directed RNA polymerase alpha subunit
MLEGRIMDKEKERRQLHTLRKTIEQSDLPERKALIKLARKSPPDRLKEIEHSLFLVMQKVLTEQRKESSFKQRHICCLELPEEYERKLLKEQIETIGKLCSFREEELNALGLTPEETSEIKALMGDVGLALKI